MDMGFSATFLLGLRLVPVQLKAKWHSLGDGRWSFVCDFSANGRFYRSIQEPTINAEHIRIALEGLDSAQWLSTNAHDNLIGVVDCEDLNQIAGMTTFCALKSFPEINPAELYCAT